MSEARGRWPASVVERAAGVELLVLDVDGVLTDGRLWYGPAGEALKAIDVRDGHGLVLLREEGLRVAILSGRPQPLLAERFSELKIWRVIERCHRKAEVLDELAEGAGVALSSVAFVGDDVNDLGALARAGLSLAPADAAPEVRASVDHVCRAPGGRGAVREVCELLLTARGRWSFS